MSELVFLVEDDPDGGYSARALGHSIFTEADTLDELRGMIRNAVVCHFDQEEDRPRVMALAVRCQCFF